MKRKITGGGGFFQRTLRRRVEKSSFSTAGEIADDLRRKYRDYRRTKEKALIRLVDDALLHSSTRNENHDDMEGPSVSQKNEEEEEEDDSKKNEATLHISSTSYDSGSAIESNRTVSEEEEEDRRGKEVKVRKKGGFKDLGGMKEIFEELKTDLVLLRCPELARELGVKPIGGILLHGLPGCGKTRLAHAIAYELGFNFYPQSATELVSGVSGTHSSPPNLNSIHHHLLFSNYLLLI